MNIHRVPCCNKMGSPPCLMLNPFVYCNKFTSTISSQMYEKGRRRIQRIHTRRAPRESVQFICEISSVPEGTELNVTGEILHPWNLLLTFHSHKNAVNTFMLSALQFQQGRESSKELDKKCKYKNCKDRFNVGLNHVCFMKIGQLEAR